MCERFLTTGDIGQKKPISIQGWWGKTPPYTFAKLRGMGVKMQGEWDAGPDYVERDDGETGVD